MMYRSCVEGVQGDFAGVSALEIRSIPDYTILAGTASEANENVRERFSSFLTEIGQRYRRLANSETVSVCLEILCVSTAAKGQVSSASITFFLIVHAMDNNEAGVESALSQCVASAEHLLSSLHFEYKNVSYEERIAPLVKSVSTQASAAITRAPRITPIGTQYIQTCFEYDRFPIAHASHDVLMQVLSSHPGSMLSFQVLPTQFSNEEHVTLSNYSQMLGIAAAGNQMPGMEMAPSPSAAAPAETYKYYLENTAGALFSYSFLLCGSSQAVADLAGAFNSSVGYKNGKQTSFVHFAIDPNEVMKDENFHFLPWAVGEITESLYFEGLSSAGLFNDSNASGCLWLPGVVTADEASGFMSLPIGTDSVSSLYRVLTAANVAHEFRKGILDDADIIVGELKSSPDHSIGFNLKDLTRHMLVVGTPGSGKTTFSVGLLDRLWKKFGIPFLVIEPAKNEYRALVQSIPDLQVFTPGKSNISPFVMNPFVPPKGVRLETYKATLLTVFSAGVSMETPLDRLFEQAVDECYLQYGWLDSYTVDDDGRIFNIDDFVLVFRKVMEKIGYVGDASNIVRAGLVRLQRMQKLFDTYQSIPIEDLLNKPTVIELAAIENSDEKSLLIALILLLIQTYVTTNYVGRGDLRNVILLEEAHVLLGEGNANSSSGSNPSAIAQSLLKRMLAEIRSAGVGIVIADQSPRKVTQDVIGLTDIKLAFRLVELEDRTILSDATTMSQAQCGRLANLQAGEGFLFYQKIDHPEEVQTPDYRLNNKIEITLDDDSIANLSTYWKNHSELLKPYPTCKKSKYCGKGCNIACREFADNCAKIIYSNNFEGIDSETHLTASIINSVISDFMHSNKQVARMITNGKVSKQMLGYCIQVHLYRLIRYVALKKIYRS